MIALVLATGMAALHSGSFSNTRSWSTDDGTSRSGIQTVLDWVTPPVSWGAVLPSLPEVTSETDYLPIGFRELADLHDKSGADSRSTQGGSHLAGESVDFTDALGPVGVLALLAFGTATAWRWLTRTRHQEKGTSQDPTTEEEVSADNHEEDALATGVDDRASVQIDQSPGLPEADGASPQDRTGSDEGAAGSLKTPDTAEQAAGGENPRRSSSGISGPPVASGLPSPRPQPTPPPKPTPREDVGSRVVLFQSAGRGK